MKHLRLLQIGDIHYPSSKSSSIKVDLKDPSFPQALVQVSAADAMHNTFKQILTLLDEKNTQLDGVLLCGDLTSYGNTNGYKDCLNYLEQTLRIKDANRWPVNTVHVVPGNHDVNRAGRDPEGNDLYRKFDPIITEWDSFGLNVFEPKKYRATDIVSSDNVNARVFSLNSCIGCGERKFLPEQIRQELAELIESRLELEYNEDTFPLPQEDLDTPAFKEEDITGVCQEIRAMDRRTVPILLAHHNLLPQAVPRISIYTELVNAGLVRSRLAEIEKPVIYCHGHIHDDPIEVITSPGTNSIGLVCISAPEIVKGFNVLEIQYAHERAPLGCVVYAYRVHRDGGVKLFPSTRIPFQLKNDGHFGGTTQKLIFQSLAKLPAFVFHRFDDIYAKINRTVKKPLGHGIQKSTLSEALLEAEWLGFVEILHRDDESKYWQFQRIIP